MVTLVKVLPVSRSSPMNNNKKEFHEQKKDDVKTTAAILRISEQGKSQRRTD